MAAKPQYGLTAAAGRVGADTSTVFRTVQRIEKSLGQRLFERSRHGYLPSQTMQRIAEHAERIEAELESARALASGPGQEVAGRVRLTTVDTVLRDVVLPLIPSLAAKHPLLQLELTATHE